MLVNKTFRPRLTLCLPVHLDRRMRIKHVFWSNQKATIKFAWTLMVVIVTENG